MENEQQDQKEDSGPKVGVASLLLDTAFRKEAMELKARYESVVEIMDDCRELVSLCNAWIAEQTDFEVNEMKKAMVMAFYEKIQNHQSTLAAECQEINPRIMALSAKFQDAGAAKEEVPHGNPAKNS